MVALVEATWKCKNFYQLKYFKLKWLNERSKQLKVEKDKYTKKRQEGDFDGKGELIQKYKRQDKTE